MNKLKTIRLIKDIKILVVENDVVNVFLISKIFKRWEIEFKTVQSVEDVIKELRNVHYDLLLIGIYISSVDCLELIQLIKTGCLPRRLDMPILVFSSAWTENEKINIINAGVEDLMDMPFEVDLLYEKIRSSVSQ